MEATSSVKEPMRGLPLPRSAAKLRDRGSGPPWPGRRVVYWFGVLFATIGAGAVLGALAFVSLLVGLLINAMIVLMAGPLIDRYVLRRR